MLISEGFLLLPRVSGYAELIDVARRANVAIHVLDPRGLETAFADASRGERPGGVMPGTALTLPALEMESLAGVTGGHVFGPSDAEVALRRVAAESDAYYLLGYAPEAPKSGERRVEVRVRREGLRTVARRRYFVPADPAKPASPASTPALGAMRSLADATELPLRVATLFFEANRKGEKDLETKVNGIRKGSGAQNSRALLEQLNKISRSSDEIHKTDFFSSRAGITLRSRIDALNAALKGFTEAAPGTKPGDIPPRKLKDYQGKVWITRRRPYVDRMASAWLISKFIDKKAAFDMLDAKDLGVVGRDKITFDMSGGVFTHVGDLCTFEVLVRSFGLKYKAVKKIAEVVHEIDHACLLPGSRGRGRGVRR